eukprot:gene12697-12828_t
MRLYDIRICVVLLLLAASNSFSQPVDVVKLSSQTFEHQTQAATGQTTGHWCVLFSNSSNSDSKQQVVAEDAWEQLAADEDKTTIYAKVDVGRSTAVSSRFNIQATPAAILFRDRAMYMVPLEESALNDADKLSAAVHSFVSTGYEEQEALAVPDVPSPLDAIKEFISYLDIEPSITLFMGIGMMLFGLVMFFLHQRVVHSNMLLEAVLPTSATHLVLASFNPMARDVQFYRSMRAPSQMCGSFFV